MAGNDFIYEIAATYPKNECDNLNKIPNRRISFFSLYYFKFNKVVPQLRPLTPNG